MRHIKTSFAMSGISISFLVAFTVLCLSFQTFVGYIMSALFTGLVGFEVYRLYRKLWLYNWGKPLPEKKKRKLEQYRGQMRDYQRYNKYHVWYRFADATEHEYLAEKANETLKKIKRR